MNTMMRTIWRQKNITRHAAIPRYQRATSGCFFALFGWGGFYELFYEDAVNAAQFLEFILTLSELKNAKIRFPWLEFPIIQQYIDALIRKKGYKVLTDGRSQASRRCVVKREVVKSHYSGDLA